MNINITPPVILPPVTPIEAIAVNDAFLWNSNLCIKDGNDLSFHNVTSGDKGHVPNGQFVNPITVQITINYVV